MHLPAVSLLGFTLFASRCASTSTAMHEADPSRISTRVVRSASAPAHLIDRSSLSADPRAARAKYQVDLTVSVVPTLGAPREYRYTLNVADGEDGVLAANDDGFRPASARFSLRLTRDEGGRLALRHDVEWMALTGNAHVNQARSHGEHWVNEGIPTVLAMTEQPRGRQSERTAIVARIRQLP